MTHQLTAADPEALWASSAAAAAAERHPFFAKEQLGSVGCFLRLLVPPLDQSNLGLGEPRVGAKRGEIGPVGQIGRLGSERGGLTGLAYGSRPRGSAAPPSPGLGLAEVGARLRTIDPAFGLLESSLPREHVRKQRTRDADRRGFSDILKKLPRTPENLLGRIGVPGPELDSGPKAPSDAYIHRRELVEDLDASTEQSPGIGDATLRSEGEPEPDEREAFEPYAPAEAGAPSQAVLTNAAQVDDVGGTLDMGEDLTLTGDYVPPPLAALLCVAKGFPTRFLRGRALAFEEQAMGEGAPRGRERPVVTCVG